MLEVWQGGLRKSLPRVDFMGRDWVTLSGRANEELTQEKVELIPSEHSVIGVDGKTKILACECKPEHAESYNEERADLGN